MTPQYKIAKTFKSFMGVAFCVLQKHLLFQHMLKSTGLLIWQCHIAEEVDSRHVASAK